MSLTNTIQAPLFHLLYSYLTVYIFLSTTNTVSLSRMAEGEDRTTWVSIKRGQYVHQIVVILSMYISGHFTIQCNLCCGRHYTQRVSVGGG